MWILDAKIRFRVSGFGVQVSGFSFRVSGFGFAEIETVEASGAVEGFSMGKSRMNSVPARGFGSGTP